MKKVLIASLVLALGSVVMASTEDEMTSLSYISYLERYATVQPASGDESLEAVVNMPLVAGDRVDTAREARMEVVLADGNTMWLDEYTTLSLDAVAFSRDSEAERSVIYLAEGSVVVEVTDYGLAGRPTRIDSRGAVVYLNQKGMYRLQALPSGGMRVEVLSGVAEASTSGGGVLIRSETAAEVGGGEVQRSENQLTWNDDFAAWVEMRRQIAAGESAQHVDLRYSRQAAQLDSYGSWLYVDSINAWAWQPTVGGSWQPYNAGRWYWTPTGYAWISYEPWGWLPYHYGSWYHDVGYGWVWSWGRHWAPAWVSWMWWPGYVGWCPYGYYNSWYWGHYGGGYHPGYSPPGSRPPYPGGGGGHAGQPPRRDVMPPRTATGRVGGETGVETQEGSAAAVDLNGKVRMASVDRRGWTVVSQDDFASPNQARLARSGEGAIPNDPDQTGVVMTGPLATRSPSSANPRSEIERVFRGVEARNSTDVSPLMARDGSLSPEAARRLAPRTTMGDISRRSSESAAANRQTVSPRLSLSGNSPFASNGGLRPSQPNLYRPTLYSGRTELSGGLAGSGASSGSRQLVAPRSTSGIAGTRQPIIVPGTGSSAYSRPPISSRSGTSGVRSPSSLRGIPGRYTTPRSGSVGGTSSSGSRSRSSTGSSRAPTRRTSPSAGSSRSSGSRSRSSAGGTRSSGGSSTKSSGSSGGARKR